MIQDQQNTLFDNIEREYKGPAAYSEPQFTYVNRSARDHFEHVRRELEVWFAEYRHRNPNNSIDLRNRFRSNDDKHHLAALAELFVHHLLLQNGLDPITHPELKHSRKKPEFLVKRGGTDFFYLEVVLVFDEKKTQRQEKFEANIGDVVDSVNSPDFLISFEILRRDANTQPKLSHLRDQLQIFIDGLVYDDVCKQYETRQTLPSHTWKQAAWEIEFTASPVTNEARQKRTSKSRNVGYKMPPVEIVKLDEAIKENVIKKAKKYGSLGIPFIIVTSIIRDGGFCDDDTILEALYGKQTVDILIGMDGSEEIKPSRNWDGIWISPKLKAINTRLSTLMVISRLSCSTIETAKPVMWHNPHATHKIDDSVLNVEQRKYDEEKKKFVTLNPDNTER